MIPLHPLLQEEEQGEGGGRTIPLSFCFLGWAPLSQVFRGLASPSNLATCPTFLLCSGWAEVIIYTRPSGTPVRGLQACKRQEHREVLVFACACVCASAPVSNAVPSGLFLAGTLAIVTQTEDPRATCSRHMLQGPCVHLGTPGLAVVGQRPPFSLSAATSS